MHKSIKTIIILLLILNSRMAFSDNDFKSQEFLVPMGSFSMDLKVNVLAEENLKLRNITKQKYDYSCGSAALTTILNLLFDLSLNEAEVIDGLIIHGETEKIKHGRRFSLLDMKRYLATLDIEGAGYKATINDMAEIPYPAVISINIEKFKHFVVLMGYTDGHVIIADPAFGHMTKTISEFDKIWANKVFFSIHDKKSKTNRVNKLDDSLLRYVSESSYYNSVLRNNMDSPNHSQLRSQSNSLFTSGILGPIFK